MTINYSKMTNRPFVALIHIICWVLIFASPLIFSDRDASFSMSVYLHRSCLPFCCFLVFYIFYLWLVPAFLIKGNKRMFYPLAALAVVLMSVVLYLFLQATRPDFSVLGIPPRPLHGMPPKWLFSLRDMVILVFVAGLATTLKVSMRWRESEQRAAEAERQRTEAELKSLKNQLNPHFLLNTLNNIYALIAFNTDKAQEAVQQLSKLLRYVLYDNSQTFVPLQQEVDFIRNYIALMRIRLPKEVNLSVSIDISDAPSLTVAPLLFISLIENAFKHGVSPTAESMIYISIAADANGRVVCKTLNTNFPKTATDKSGSGVGLQQVQKRLDILYPNAYKWLRTADDTIYTSVLTIDTNPKH